MDSKVINAQRQSDGCNYEREGGEGVESIKDIPWRVDASDTSLHSGKAKLLDLDLQFISEIR